MTLPSLSFSPALCATGVLSPHVCVSVSLVCVHGLNIVVACETVQCILSWLFRYFIYRIYISKCLAAILVLFRVVCSVWTAWAEPASFPRHLRQRQLEHLNSVAKQIFVCGVEPVSPADTADSQSWVRVLEDNLGKSRIKSDYPSLVENKNCLWRVHSYLTGSLVQKLLMDSCLCGFNCERLSIWLTLSWLLSMTKALLVWNCSVCLLQRISLVEPTARQGRLKQLVVFALCGSGDSLLSSTPSSVLC